MSCALTDLLQVHSLIDGPADARVAGVVRREGLGKVGAISRRVSEPRPDIRHEEFCSVTAPDVGVAELTFGRCALCWRGH